jgi:hypothetical protein
MAVCSECENSIDAFFILAEPLHDNVYGLSRSSTRLELDFKAKVEQTLELKEGLSKNLFKEYNSFRRFFDETLNQFTKERSRYFRNEQSIYSLETLAFLGDERSYKQLLAHLVSEKIGIAAQSHQVRKSVEQNVNTIIQSIKGSNENQKDTIHNSLLRNVGHQQQGLAEVQQRITRDSTAYDEYLERSHVTSLEENSNANDPLNSPQINGIPNLLLQDVKEYCPACGNLEWQGLHIRCSGVQSGEIEFEGRITDITHKYIPRLVGDAEKKLGELQRRITSYEKFRDGAKRKVNARIKRRKRAAKKAEIAELEAKIKKLKEE